MGCRCGNVPRGDIVSDPTLFDQPQFEPIRPAGTRAPTGSDRYALARTSDPSTSRRAAESLNLHLDDRHRGILALLRREGPLTDDGLAEIVVRAGYYDRHEKARRAIRTLREEHDLIVAHLDPEGNHAEATNSSGRAARLWVVR
jgi:hypothetical protein